MWGSLVVKRRLKLTASAALHSTHLQYRSMRMCGWLHNDARRLNGAQPRRQDSRTLDLDTHPTRVTRQRSPRVLSQLSYCTCAVSRATNDCKWCYSQLWILQLPSIHPIRPAASNARPLSARSFDILQHDTVSDALDEETDEGRTDFSMRGVKRQLTEESLDDVDVGSAMHPPVTAHRRLRRLGRRGGHDVVEGRLSWWGETWDCTYLVLHERKHLRDGLMHLWDVLSALAPSSESAEQGWSSPQCSSTAVSPSLDTDPPVTYVPYQLLLRTGTP